MICTDCKTPMVSIRQAQANGVPTGHRRHMGHGLCSTCIHTYRASLRTAKPAVSAPEQPPFDLAKTRADLAAWTRRQRARAGRPLNAPIPGVDI